MSEMRELMWPMTWAALGIALAACAALRGLACHRRMRRLRAATRPYRELRAGDFAAIGGTFEAGDARSFYVVLEEGRRVRVEPELLAVNERAAGDAFVAEGLVHVAGILAKCDDPRADGGLVLRAAPGERMVISPTPLWMRAARRRFFHLVFAAAIATLTTESVRFLTWDYFRLAFTGKRIIATLTNQRPYRQWRLSGWWLRKVPVTLLDATYTDDRGQARQFTTAVDPRTEWLWKIVDPAKFAGTDLEATAREIASEPVRMPFVILPDEPSVHQLGERAHIGSRAAFVPMIVLAVIAILYWVRFVRPESPPPRIRRRHPRVVPVPGSAA